MRVEDLMARAAKYDEDLARDIKDYVRGRNYGLVYEASKPEFVRMWKKPVVRGDLVNILPPRGVWEDTKRDNDSAEIVYKVKSISEGKATLCNEQNGEITMASVDDIVALARFDKPIYAGLKEIGRVERGGDKPYHVIINGENYHALQTLIYAYQGQVDCIYIDPPYNTGASDWKYNNNYVGEDDKYRHSKWLTFMADRLRLAKKLLNPTDSVLIVTIDEKEYLHLGCLLEEIFPDSDGDANNKYYGRCKTQMISSVISFKGSARKKQFTRLDEYIFIIEFGNASVRRLPLSDEWRMNPDDERATHLTWKYLIRSGNEGLRERSPGNFYPVYFRSDGSYYGIGEAIPAGEDRNSVVPPEGTFAVFPIDTQGREHYWNIGPEKFLDYKSKGYIKFGKPTKNGVPITFLTSGEINKVEQGIYEIDGYDENGSIISNSEYRDIMPGTQWRIKSHDATRHGTDLLTKILCERHFPYPKSLYAVHDVIKFFVAENPNALIIDFFGGSGTTLHAVNLLNAEDGGCRKCILVTNNEVSEDEERSMTAKKLRPTDKEWQDFGIARYVTWPRTVCVIEGHDIKGEPLKGDYGCQTVAYIPYEGEVYDLDTGKKKRKQFFEKIKRPLYPELTNRKMADGFEENVIFFDLEYLEPSVVSADLAFDNIAPILWLCGGCKGKILRRQKGFVLGETYAVLFDPRYTVRFVDAVMDKELIKTVFIVTDAAERYRSLCAELPQCRVLQLYESYLRSFEINAIG